MTAVERLEKQLLSHTKIENSKYVQQKIVDIAVWQLNKYLEQAKEMEKGQIEDAWDKRCKQGTFISGWHIETQNGEQYYKETYGQE